MFIPKKSFIFFIILIVIIFGAFGFGYIKFRKVKDGNTGQAPYDYEQIEQRVGELELAEKMSASEVSRDLAKKEINGVDKGIIMSNKTFTHSARLADVTGGAARGIAKAGFIEGQYRLSADFANLPEPARGDFYEGWLVRREPFAFISTGRAYLIAGMFTNLYASKNNLLEYNLYVLTLEPPDNEPAPATHILEGMLMEL